MYDTALNLTVVCAYNSTPNKCPSPFYNPTESTTSVALVDSAVNISYNLRGYNFTYNGAYYSD
jgi:hypothetical protein